MSEDSNESLAVTRLPERVAVEKGPVADADGWYDLALAGPVGEVRAWLAGEGSRLDVLGPWIGAFVAGDPVRAVVVVRSKQPLAVPEGFLLVDPNAARGVLGWWASGATGNQGGQSYDV